MREPFASPVDLAMEQKVHAALQLLKELNPDLATLGGQNHYSTHKKRPHKLQKVLIDNRGEIAKRFFFALHEEGIPSVALVTDVDRGQSWYEFADEVVYIGHESHYTNIPLVIGAALLTDANAIYAGYGFLSENPSFVKALDYMNQCSGKSIIFMGPTYNVMKVMGDKVSARELAKRHGVPMFVGSAPFTTLDAAAIKQVAGDIGYPVIVKLSAGGGGKGMQVVYHEEEVAGAVESCCRIGRDLYNDATFYLEKFIEMPIHIEVQVFNGRAVGIRKCAVQRRNQKIIEESGFTFLSDHLALSFLSSAERLAVVSGYDGCGAGTVEFLIDNNTGAYGFMEMNTRLQVEYGVTDQSLGIDLVKWQILYFDGRNQEIIGLDTIKFKMLGREHAIECRIYAEEPENDYRPSPGTITKRELPTFNGVRCDFGFGVGDKILSMYDPMIGKIIAHGATREDALIRLERALQEFYIQGVKTNISQLLRILRHPEYRKLGYTNNLIKDNPELSFVKDVKKGRTNFNMPIIYGAFAEYIAAVNAAARKFKVVAGVQGIVHSDAVTDVPGRLRVTYQGKVHIVEFVQTALDRFYALLDGVNYGVLTLGSFNDDGDDFLVSLANHSERIRVDHQLDCLVVRMRDRNNKIDYFRMTVLPDGASQDENLGAVRSPFQGSFVSFARPHIKVGDKVQKGEPLLILSAMKMETVMEAPCDGEVSFLLEDGDMARLQIAKTADGRIIGKSLKEGELLVKINVQPKAAKTTKDSLKMQTAQEARGSKDTLQLLRHDSLQGELIADMESHIDTLIELFHGMVLGFVPSSEIIEKLINLLSKLTPAQWKEVMTIRRTDSINHAILHYTSIERLFSPTVSVEGFSYPEEFNVMISAWPRSEMEISSGFKNLLDDLMVAYRLGALEAGSETQNMMVLQFFYLLKNSYEFCSQYWDRIGNTLKIAGHLNPSSGLTLITMRRLLKHTQKQLDDKSTDYVKSLIAKNFPLTALAIDTADHEGEEDWQNPSAFFDEGLAQRLALSMENGGRQQEHAEPAQAWIANHLAQRLQDLKSTFTVQALAAPLADCFLYELSPTLDKAASSSVKRYHALLYLDSSDSLDFLKKSKERMSAACHLLSLYHSMRAVGGCRLECIMRGVRLSLDRPTAHPATMSYQSLLGLGAAVHSYFESRIINYTLIELIPTVGTLRSELLKFRLKNGRLLLDLLPNDDVATPYCQDVAKADEESARLYLHNKWPIDLWAQKCLDEGTMREINVDEIEQRAAGKRVGAKIYAGTIHGSNCLLYMKDFRVMGGATGNLEGLKYAAATYLAYIKGWPLYVFNDSAGANIKEGVVSLNRGGQGFMMNSLLAQDVDSATFARYTAHQFDPDVKAVFAEMLRRFGDGQATPVKGGAAFIVAVGIGASAGLDVYGSSQATMQVFLDSHNSYRVLTGSNVIKSVLGENISNYDIGGAQVLGKWTGTVDMVAYDKLELIGKIRDIHAMFAPTKAASTIKKPVQIQAEKQGRYSTLVFDEASVQNNVDDGHFLPLRSEYHGANALLGGLARLGGKRMVIMGPRTDSGLTGAPAILKMRDILRLAQRTSTPQILVFGAYLIKPSENVTRSYGMRAQLDLMTTWNQGRAPRVHIITDVRGLECAHINASADAVIFVKNTKTNAADLAFAQMNAAFVVSTLADAFDTAHRTIHLLTVHQSSHAYQEPQALPAIPRDKGQPYNMIEMVISRCVDEGSFIEFYRDMNRPAGPNLITGLARFKGRTVGIIADQPEIKGGGADAPGAEKFRVFTEFLNKRKVPLLMLSNSSGFVPGSQQERLRIQAIGAESLDANILGNIPVVSVVLGQVYGGRQIQAFSRALRPGIVYLALQDALIAVMGETAAFDLFGTKTYGQHLEAGRRELADQYREKFISDYIAKAGAAADAHKTGVLDWTIADVSELRQHIEKGLLLAEDRCGQAFDYRAPHI